MMLPRLTLLVCITLLFAGCKKDDDEPKAKNVIDISSEFSYSNDLPGDLTFTDNKFWVSATSSDKFRAFDANTGRNMTVWAKETQWSQGLDSDNSHLYQISFQPNSQGQLVPHIASHTLNGGQWETFAQVNLPQQINPFDLVYNIADSVFVVGFSDQFGSRVQFFNPATGALGDVLRNGEFSGMTYHKKFIWLAETIRNGSTRTFKIYKLDLLGNILNSYDLEPTDGDKNHGGTVDGIVFKDNELWYLNGALLKIVKSDIKAN